MIKEALDKIPELLLEKAFKTDGTCFVDAYKYMDTNHSLTLVHGLVTGQGPIEGIVYNHAWVEDGNTVIDASLKEQGRDTYKFPKDLYYAIGNIQKKTTFKYTYEEMVSKMVETENYGPWEKILNKNKY
ncbi:MAG: hypothetical protein KAI79_05990 [Bacteroidales bacterium]|nr:hypothetical protein [Bacteroidales bacterium]